ncbi:MAG: transcriptional regulator GcvA [Pseudomonadota bacterium]
MKRIQGVTSGFPSLASLRAFEATARHLSFTRAARELNLTQTAISHRIKGLETLLGTRLFVRDGANIRLSDIGHEYLASVRSAIGVISSATTRAKDHDRANVLTIVSMVNFGLKALIPNLHDFRRRHPDIALRIGTIASFDSLARHDYDVALRYGTGDWPGFTSVRLAPEACFPVCSPKLLKSGPRLRTPDDLRNHTVLRSASHILGDEWSQWLDKANMKKLVFADEIMFDFLFASVEAAISGLGVVMGRTSVVNRELEAGTLVEPFSIRVPTASGYHIASKSELKERKAVRLFTDWVLEQFGDRALDA